MCPVSQLQVMPGRCKVPLSRKPSTIHCPTCWPRIIFSINRVVTICLLKVGSLCGRIGSARKEMSNQTALSPSHMPSFYCFYPPFFMISFLCHSFSSALSCLAISNPSFSPFTAHFLASIFNLLNLSFSPLSTELCDVEYYFN